MEESMNSVCVPGERLGSLSEYTCGDGTYVRNGFIYSKLCGNKTIVNDDDKLTLQVERDVMKNIIPEIDSIAMCKIVNSNPRLCKVIMISVNGISLKGSFKGIIRQEDVRATEKDRVKMYESFRPGDIILARVMSLGDSQSYYLTTAENELGVVYAVSQAGSPMIPISWCEMQCTSSGGIEHRKVAKVKVRQVWSFCLMKNIYEIM